MRIVPDQQILITIAGTPQPGGSKTSIPVPNRSWNPGMPNHLRFVHDKSGRPVVNTIDANSSKLKKWRKTVVDAANAQYDGPLLDGPLILDVLFLLGRPKDHFRTGRHAHLLKDSAPRYPATRPDATKLWRAAEDSLTGVVWTDDAIIVDQRVRKVYAPGVVSKGGEGEMAIVRVREIPTRTVGESRELAAVA